MLNHDLAVSIPWIRANSPLTESVFQELARSGALPKARLAYSAHIEPKMLPHIEFFSGLGLELHVSPCVPGVAHPASLSWLQSKGIRVYGSEASSWEALQGEWRRMLEAEPEFISDMGGGLILEAAKTKSSSVKAASEATTTGIEKLRRAPLAFPVFNWNDIPFKNLMHNRYEVGSGVWHGFRKLTGLDPCRMRVGIIGFGLVGQSVASIARGLGARAYVHDVSPAREVAAASEGYGTGSLENLAEICEVLVSATGARGTIDARRLANARSGLFLANAGHDDREIDLSGFRMKRQWADGIEEFEPPDGSRTVLLLGKGRLLNLAAGGGSAINTFDLVTALISRVIKFTIAQGPRFAPGLHALPPGFGDDLLQMELRRREGK